MNRVRRAVPASYLAGFSKKLGPLLFDRSVQGDCWWGAGSGRVGWHVRLAEKAPLSGDRVRVIVSVERTVVDPLFGIGVSTATHVFVVGREGDAWRIVSFDWPSPCF